MRERERGYIWLQEIENFENCLYFLWIGKKLKSFGICKGKRSDNGVLCLRGKLRVVFIVTAQQQHHVVAAD